MTLQDFDRWLAYSDKCNRVLAETLNAAPQTFDAPFETESAFKSARAIMAHIIGAEERWIKLRVLDNPLPVIYEERAATTIDGVFADAATIRAETRVYLASLSEADLAKTKEISFPRYNFSRTLTIADVLFQILTHEMYHRGQITMALQRQGIDTPNFDYVFV